MWTQFIVWAITSVISYLLQPKPPKPQPGKIDIPTVEEGRKIGVLFGGRWIKSPHIFWWGDVRTTPIKSKGGKK
jgi:hypothetical protein